MTRSVPPRTRVVAKVWRRMCLCRRRHKHVLRHTCVTNLVRCGTDIVVVAELAGHRRLETTRRYSLAVGGRSSGRDGRSPTRVGVGGRNALRESSAIRTEHQRLPGVERLIAREKRDSHG